MKNQKPHFTQASKENFFVIGLSYVKADAETRGHFSVSGDVQKDLLERI